MTEIVFIRHGRSGHVHRGWIDLDGFSRWRVAYEAAGLLPNEVPPHELRELAIHAGVLIASDAPRAVESAKLLAPGRDVIPSELLRELDLHPPSIRSIRLPLGMWALAIGVQWIARVAMSRPHVSSAEEQRARAAADWLAALAERHGTVVAVGHATFRSVLAKEFASRGWRCSIPRRRASHWSAWSFTQ